MRNKLYLFLFPLYLLVLGFILYINGAFTGDVTSLSNLLINVGFLVIIGILFIISAVNFVRLNCCSDALVAATEKIWEERKTNEGPLWKLYQRREGVFQNEDLDEAFLKYQKRTEWCLLIIIRLVQER